MTVIGKTIKIIVLWIDNQSNFQPRKVTTPADSKEPKNGIKPLRISANSKYVFQSL
jgi:hypothetical protein